MAGLTEWKKDNLVHRSLLGESTIVDEATIEELKKNLPNLTKHYKTKDVFEAEDTRLFLNLRPDKSSITKEASCHQGKMSKLYLTVLLCYNSDGSEKLMPLIVGKLHNTQCFKNASHFLAKYEAKTKKYRYQKFFTKTFCTNKKKRIKLQNCKIFCSLNNAVCVVEKHYTTNAFPIVLKKVEL